MANNWQQSFPHLSEINDAVINDLMNNAGTINMSANSTAFHQGDACSNYLLILSGSIKVMTRAENGREIVLYRLGDGDSCVLTTSCLFGNARYPAEGISETDVTALAIPATQFNQAIEHSKPFREFVFNSFSSHLSSLITLVEEVTFGKLDIRLARRLLKLSTDNSTLETTHLQLATELGSTREVISRLLKDFESSGWLRLYRGSLEVLDKQSLEKLAAM
jgi:CRP/FNR family transcriptional regulator